MQFASARLRWARGAAVWASVVLLITVGCGCSAYHRSRLRYLVRNPLEAVHSRYFMPAVVVVFVLVLAGLATAWILLRNRADRS